jgi:class 3 adenylate cyclase
VITAAEKLLILEETDAIADAATSVDDLLTQLAQKAQDLAGSAGAWILFFDEENRLMPPAHPPELAKLRANLIERRDFWKEVVLEPFFAFPLRLKESTLAALIVERAEAPDEDTLARLATFIQRADSAVAHALDRQALEDRTRELSTIYAIDHIRDQHLPFDEMIEKVMEAMLELIPAQVAVVSLRHLFDPDTPLSLHLRGRDGDTGAANAFLENHKDPLNRLVRQAFEVQGLVIDENLGGNAHQAQCMPLILDEEIIGAFVLVGESSIRFLPRHRRLFTAVCSQVDTAIFEDLKRRRLRDVFSRYVSDDVLEEMLHGGEDFMAGRRKEVSVLFSDLRGFTTVSEKLDVDVVVRMLNEHLDAMTQVIFEHGGTVDKFIGDCVMAIFGAPLPMENHAKTALEAAHAMRQRHAEICEKWEGQGLPGVKVGIGLHTGEVFVGNIGGEAMSSYTVIGDHVNLASRLEGVSGPDEIILTQDTLEKSGGKATVTPRGELVVKGKTVPVKIHQLIKP